MNKVIINCPFNSLSFGQVSFKLIEAFYKLGVDTVIEPITDKGGQVDMRAYEVSEEFANWIETNTRRRLDYSKYDHVLKLWHINGSQGRITRNQSLLTFHETDRITPVEAKLLNLQDKVFVSSEYTAEIFRNQGVQNVNVVSLAESAGIRKLDKDFKMDDVIHFGLMGKWEKRKNTAAIIQAWAKRFGNNPKYRLSCAVTNPFFKPEDMQKTIQSVLPTACWNINFLPYLASNAEVNSFLNAIDVDLTGLSNAEGWNLPAYNASFLGKWSLVTNHTAHKEWATEDNCVLVEPSGMQPVFDGVFFQPGTPFNQGEIYSLSEEAIIAAMEKGTAVAKTPNTKGLELAKKFTWEKTAKQLLGI